MLPRRYMSTLRSSMPTPSWPESAGPAVRMGSGTGAGGDLPVPALAQQGQFALLPVDGAFGLGRAGRQQATAKQYAPRTPAHSRASSGAGAFTGDTAICTMPSSRRRITPFCSCRR
ncbi:Uncharacterised protein [Pseudomonas aeruginosa]|nr:Uncharacterised protein [Pseudomonas aeruginosa]